MKKVISLLTCLALALGTGTACFAATETAATETEVTKAGTAATEITRTIESEFTVSIPKTIEIEASETSQTFEIGAKGNISSTKQIDVTYNDATVEMARTGDDTYSGDATLAFDNNAAALTWTEENIGTDDFANQGGTVTFEETKAGEYSGTATFNIALNDAE